MKQANQVTTRFTKCSFRLFMWNISGVVLSYVYLTSHLDLRRRGVSDAPVEVARIHES